MPDPIRGRCLCGGVRYTITGEVAYMSHCHCSTCRRSTGAAFSTGLVVPREQFTLTDGADRLRTYRHTDGKDRVFCGRCGSTILTAQPWPDAPVVRVRAGTLDDDPGVRPMLHIFVGSKAPWFEIADELAQFQEGVE